MKVEVKHIILITAALFLAACHGDPPVVGQPSTKRPDYKENMINANRTIAQSEETAIDEYISRRGWKMQKLPGGTRLWEYEVGKGTCPLVSYEDTVYTIYDVESINGKLIYKDVTDTFIAGRRGEMVGLDEAVLHMHHRGKAKVILPSNLAYGIGGDGDRIPQSTILVLELKINN